MALNRILALSAGALLFAGAAQAGDEARLLRFPAIHGDQIVFTYAGDLYTVPAQGGTARRLTSDPGFEMFARFSPDGSRLAFTAQYDGNTEVYVMPAEGGVPHRATYTATLDRDDVSDRMGPNNIVMTWQDNDRIIYRSRRTAWNDWQGQLFTAHVDGGIPEQLPLPRGGWCSFSPDGKKMAYNRVFREFRTWKRYRGGQADDVWIYDLESKQTTNLTQNAAQDVFPMWHGNKVYFASDRDSNKRFNLYVTDLESLETKAVTDFAEFDVKFPSLGDKAIVFENGGFIYTLDLASHQVAKVNIRIQEDLAVGRDKLVDVSKSINDYAVSPDGSRAVFCARGDVFTVPAKYGPTRNLTATPGIHDRDAVWSPDGKWIAYISDASGEDELYLRAQDGSGEPVRVTQVGDVYKYHPVWSPDSHKLLWSDRKQRLQYVDIESREIKEVAQAAEFEIRQYAWSPDSRWIAYLKPESESKDIIHLYSLESRQTTPVTDGWYDVSQPTFSPDGKYLFFESDRSFEPVSSQTEYVYAYFDMARVYFVTLARDTQSPFEPKSDEVKTAKKEEPKKEEAKNDKKDEAAAKPAFVMKVDLEGIKDRIAALPIAPASYSHLAAVTNRVFYIRHSRKAEKPRLCAYDLEKLKETELGDAGSFVLTADLKKMLVSAENAYSIIDLPGDKLDLKDKLNLAEMQVTLDRTAEWNQIFNECWRQMRDFLFDPNLHHVDWPKMRATYGALIPHVNHRADLTYVIGEMIGELNIGHAYVGGGDYPKAERIKTGLLGAVIVRDKDSGYYRISHILKGQNWDSHVRSPLTEIGVRASEGDYILAINGKRTDQMRDLYAALVNTVDRQVRLKLNAKPSEEGGYETTVVPIADERPLYYYNWVEGNIEKVAKATNGKVGYIHIPDMGVPGMNEFVKHYYPQLRKEALIIDVRGNGGGNISPQIMERLRREMAMITISRNSVPHVDPSGTHYGPKVCLLDEFSASDGDIFPYRFKKYKVGPLIGKRSWGGVVGIRGSLPLLDGGYLNRPEFSRYDAEGREWIMEGHGVDPDIVVDNDPAREYAGIDDQLNKGIEVILEELKKNPPRLAPPPAYPDKSK